MTRRDSGALESVGFLWLVCGCSVTRPVPVGMDADDAPARSASVPLRDVVELRTGHLSPGHTGAAIGGALVAAGAALAILVEDGEPLD